MGCRNRDTFFSRAVQNNTVLMTYKLIVDFDTSQYEPDTNGIEKAEPFLLVCLVDMIADVAGPVDSSGLGVSNISDIVDMSCLAVRFRGPLESFYR